MTTKINLTASDDNTDQLYMSFTDLHQIDKIKLQEMLISGKEIFLIKSGMMPIKLIPAKLG